mgnify:CR=1 FL=1
MQSLHFQVCLGDQLISAIEQGQMQIGELIIGIGNQHSGVASRAGATDTHYLFACQSRTCKAGGAHQLPDWLAGWSLCIQGAGLAR